MLVVTSNHSTDKGKEHTCMSECHLQPHPRLPRKPGLRWSEWEGTLVVTQCTSTLGLSSLAHGYLPFQSSFLCLTNSDSPLRARCKYHLLHEACPEIPGEWTVPISVWHHAFYIPLKRHEWDCTISIQLRVSLFLSLTILLSLHPHTSY